MIINRNTKERQLINYLHFSDVASFPPEYPVRFKKVDGPAAGLFLTHSSTTRNGISYWVHTQPNNVDDKGELWKITHKDYDSQSCYNIEAISGL